MKFMAEDKNESMYWKQKVDTSQMPPAAFYHIEQLFNLKLDLALLRKIFSIDAENAKCEMVSVGVQCDGLSEMESQLMPWANH